MKIHPFKWNTWSSDEPPTSLSEFNSAKKILIVAGDSWTNRVPEHNGSEPSSWVYEFAKLRGYDFVILSAMKGDSSKQTFLKLVNLFTDRNITDDTFLGEHNRNSWLTTNFFKDKNVDVVVQWTSIIRDFSEFTSWYKPHTFASTPYLGDDEFKKQMYEEYVMNILNEKYYSYKMQVYSWQLQKYFERWNISYYFWMGFCDLVPVSVENTDMDIRKYLNKDRWFNLYDKPGNMADYLYYIEKNELPARLPSVLTEGGPTAFRETLSKSIRNMVINNKPNSSLEDSLFLRDLHPSDSGNKIIAQTLYERF